MLSTVTIFSIVILFVIIIIIVLVGLITMFTHISIHLPYVSLHVLMYRKIW